MQSTQTATADDPLLTAEIAARRIGVSPATVRRWIREGDVQSEPIGPKRRRIRASIVDRLAPKISGQNAQTAHANL